MELLLGIFIVVGWILGVAFSRIFTTLIHELGHAIPSLMFTDDVVAIHVGSYGDEKNSFNLNLGRLKAYFKLDILRWNIGLCQHKGAKTYLENLIIVLGGPVFSLGIGIVMLALILKGGWSDEAIFIFSFFILSSVYDFFVNIIPINQPIHLYNGTPTYNDGTQLVQLMRESKYPKTYFDAVELFNEQKYEAAAVSFRQVLEAGFDKREIHTSLINSFVYAKKYDDALEHILSLKEKKQLNLKDYPLVGQVFLRKGEYQNALNFFNKYLYKHFEDVEALNQRGYTYLQMGEYQKAIHDFDSAIIHSYNNAFAFNHRGLAKIRLGDLEEAKADLDQAESLDKTDAFLYLHLGYFFKEKRQLKEALENFQKAKDMEVDFHGIDYLIETSKERDF